MKVEYIELTEYGTEQYLIDCKKVYNVILTLTDGSTEVHTYEDTVIPSNEFKNRTDIASVNIENGITEIGDNIFYGNTELTSITIPGSVTSLGSSAFENCTKLESITIPGSIEDISANLCKGCTSLESVVIEDGVKCIIGWSFSGCTSLTSVTIPDTLEDIMRVSFDGVPTSGTLNCDDDWYDNLTSANITNLGNVYNWRQDGNVILTLSDGKLEFHNYSDGVIPIGAFVGKNNVVSVEIKDTITAISNNTFSGCSNISSVTIGNSVTNIDANAFKNCSSLKSITIPNSVTSIGNSAFASCVKLSSVTLSNGVTSIGNSAFINCHGLTSITIPNSVRTIGNSAFYTCLSLTSITIGRNVTTINSGAFSNCKVRTITIPDSVTNLDSQVFVGCTSLTSVTFGSGITEIKYGTLSGCTSLASVTIPSTISTIGENAFADAPTSGTLNCDDDWYDNLTSANITNLGNVYNWREKPKPMVKVTWYSGGEDAYEFEDGIIPDSRFHDNNQIVSVEITKGITTIGSQSISSCGSLESITIASSVTNIKTLAMVGNFNLTTVNYKGTVAQWNSITKEEEWFGGETNIVHCSDGDVNIYEL